MKSLKCNLLNSSRVQSTLKKLSIKRKFGVYKKNERLSLSKYDDNKIMAIFSDA